MKYLDAFVETTVVIIFLLLLLQPATFVISNTIFYDTRSQLLAFGQHSDNENEDNSISTTNEEDQPEDSSDNESTVQSNGKSDSNDCNGDRDFDVYPDAQVNDLGIMGADYYISYGDDGYTCYQNDDANEIDNLELYRNQMPGPIENDETGDSNTDVQISFGNCSVNCVGSDMDGLNLYLFPDDWSDKKILNSFLNDTDPGKSNYKVGDAECSDSLQECTASFNLDSYSNGNKIENGNYKLVINPVYDEANIIYINEAEILTAL